jgi:ethanolaminephosphotransferase
VDIELKYALLFSLTILGIVLYIQAGVVVYYDSLKKKSSLYEGVLQSIQFFGFLALIIIWIFSPTSLVHAMPRSYMLIFGITFGYLISRLIISHVTHTRFVRFPIILWPLPFVVFNSWSVFLPFSEFHLLVFYVLFVSVVYLHFVLHVIGEITRYLKIDCFRIKVRYE